MVNWFETEYPSPAFPTPGSDGKPKVGSTQYFSAYGAVTRGYPLLRGAQPGPGEADPPEVLDLMHRVTMIPMVRRTLFGPRVTVFTKDGRSFTKEGTGREFIWDFDEQAKRIQPIAPGLAIPEIAIRGVDRCVPQPGSHRQCGKQADRADPSARRISAALIRPVAYRPTTSASASNCSTCRDTGLSSKWLAPSATTSASFSRTCSGVP